MNVLIQDDAMNYCVNCVASDRALSYQPGARRVANTGEWQIKEALCWKDLRNEWNTWRPTSAR